MSESNEREIGRLDGRLSALEDRVDGLEGRIDSRLTAIDTKLDKLTETVAQARGGASLARWLTGGGLLAAGAAAGKLLGFKVGQ